MSLWKRRKNQRQQPIKNKKIGEYPLGLVKKGPRFVSEEIEIEKKPVPQIEFEIEGFDPTLIVRQLLEGLKCQGISAAHFCNIIGLHKNTISRWKQGKPGDVCPDSYAFLFKRLVLDMKAGVDMRELFDLIRPPEIRENIIL